MLAALIETLRPFREGWTRTFEKSFLLKGPGPVTSRATKQLLFLTILQSHIKLYIY